MSQFKYFRLGGLCLEDRFYFHNFKRLLDAKRLNLYSGLEFFKTRKKRPIITKYLN